MTNKIHNYFAPHRGLTAEKCQLANTQFQTFQFLGIN